MIALRDMNETTGTLALIPRSHLFFHDYCKWVKPGDGYVEYQDALVGPFVALRLKEGQLVIWDSRTTHSRFRGKALSNRYAALVTYTKAKKDPELIQLRMNAFQQGIGYNHHEAGLRATAPPRCEQSLRKTEENLTPLGRKLYGIDSWEP
jgi:ectoine hydroxylase-related dioxygenase (phytanoyl-CoA dioxygenase family)